MRICTHTPHTQAVFTGDSWFRFLWVKVPPHCDWWASRRTRPLCPFAAVLVHTRTCDSPVTTLCRHCAEVCVVLSAVQFTSKQTHEVCVFRAYGLSACICSREWSSSRDKTVIFSFLSSRLSALLLTPRSRLAFFFISTHDVCCLPLLMMSVPIPGFVLTTIFTFATLC